ncbi:hypothetical protein QR680_014583 [Steinernema hermaphroditum]|uniref:Uncharacterized protein n=1 Tax=Steinernema hermaphroditum TaxID=289476 RepID=A0AA39M4G5_9BILA|nr:hypothetical protein QR680_014583 [Steinernema hermaphroditum]
MEHQRSHHSQWTQESRSCTVRQLGKTADDREKYVSHQTHDRQYPERQSRCEVNVTNFPSQSSSFGQSATFHRPVPETDLFEVVFQTSNVLKAGTDGHFQLYLAQTDACGRICGQPLGPYPIKSEKEYLETGTVHRQAYQTGSFKHHHLLTGGADALIIKKSTVHWYEVISDGWKPQCISLHYKSNGITYDKHFYFPKSNDEGWLKEDGFYVIYANGKFKYFHGSAKSKVEEIVGI